MGGADDEGWEVEMGDGGWLGGGDGRCNRWVCQMQGSDGDEDDGEMMEMEMSVVRWV